MKEQEHKIHQPEIILLDGSDEEGHPFEEQVHSFEALQGLSKKHYTIAARFGFLLVSFFVACAALVMLLLTLANGAVALLTMLNRETVANVKKRWQLFMKLVAVATGCFIGVFSPTLGFGMIMLYLLLHGQDMEKDRLAKMIKERLFR